MTPTRNVGPISGRCSPRRRPARGAVHPATRASWGPRSDIFTCFHLRPRSSSGGMGSKLVLMSRRSRDGGRSPPSRQAGLANVPGRSGLRPPGDEISAGIGSTPTGRPIPNFFSELVICVFEIRCHTSSRWSPNVRIFGNLVDGDGDVCGPEMILRSARIRSSSDTQGILATTMMACRPPGRSAVDQWSMLPSLPPRDG
jgi:hypothetical protein